MGLEIARVPESWIPEIMYHGTVWARLYSIVKRGLIPNYDRNYGLSKNSVVYLASDLESALNWGWFPYTMGLEECFKIRVIFHIDTTKLDKSRFGVDTNLHHPECEQHRITHFEYWGHVPPECILSWTILKW